MTHRFGRVEGAIIFECLREVRASIGFSTAKALAERLTQLDFRIPVKVALAYVNGRPVARHWYSIVAIVSLSLLAERYEQVKEYDTSRNGRMSTYIDQLLAEYKSIDHGTFELADKEEEQGAGKRYADIIFNNWKASFLRGNGALQTGIYQMFRRYKPESELSSIELSNDQTNVINHAVICELIYVDSDAMECLMITSGGLNL